MLAKPKPDERLRGESTPAYEAFCCYFEMGEGRSLKKVSNALQKTLAMIQNWNEVNRWQDRIAALATEAERVKRREKRQDILKMAQRHADIAGHFQVKVLLGLKALKIEDLSPADLVRFFEVSCKVERDARKFASHDIAHAAQGIAELARAVGVEPSEAEAPAAPAAKLTLVEDIRGESMSDIFGRD